MTPPPGSVPDSFAIRFIYEKGGKNYEFAATELPADLDTYKFVERVDKLVRKGNAEPPIKGFNLTGPGGTDSVQSILQLPYALLLFCEELSSPPRSWKEDFEAIYQLAKQKNVPAWLVTTQPATVPEAISGTSFRDIPIFSSDYTAIRTAARTNPCLYLLKNGTIIGKWAKNDFDEVKKFIGELTP